jgi:hypothetical protein
VSYDASEQDVLAKVFADMLKSTTKDGGVKRARGEKPPWWRDNAHEAAIFSHLNKWKHGEKVDKDSGVHPLVHAAWRCLAIAYQETNGQVDPAPKQPYTCLVFNCSHYEKQFFEVCPGTITP